MESDTKGKFSKVYDIRSSEMGPDYRLKNESAARYFQECFAQYCTSKHLAAFHISKDHLKWIITEMNIEFLDQMPRWSENVLVEVWLSEVKRYRLYVDFQLLYQGKVITRGDSSWYILNSETGRPANVSDIASRFELLPELTLGSRQKNSFAPEGGSPAEPFGEQHHKVTFFDLDFNYHVNNLCYTAIAFNPLPVEFLNKNILRSYSVKYSKETFLNDELYCRVQRQGDTLFHQLYNKKDDAEVCLLRSNWIPRQSETTT